MAKSPAYDRLTEDTKKLVPALSSWETQVHSMMETQRSPNELRPSGTPLPTNHVPSGLRDSRLAFNVTELSQFEVSRLRLPPQSAEPLSQSATPRELVQQMHMQPIFADPEERESRYTDGAIAATPPSPGVLFDIPFYAKPNLSNSSESLEQEASPAASSGASHIYGIHRATVSGTSLISHFTTLPVLPPLDRKDIRLSMYDFVAHLQPKQSLAKARILEVVMYRDLKDMQRTFLTVRVKMRNQESWIRLDRVVNRENHSQFFAGMRGPVIDTVSTFNTRPEWGIISHLNLGSRFPIPR